MTKSKMANRYSPEVRARAVNQTPADARRALEQCEGSAHDALAQNETDQYEIQTRKLSL